MNFVPGENEIDNESLHIVDYCEKVIEAIKTERGVLRSRLSSLAWKQKRYEKMIEDLRSTLE